MRKRRENKKGRKDWKRVRERGMKYDSMPADDK
jgi:hypothetical protein